MHPIPEEEQAGWPRGLLPGLPQARTCRITAYGQREHLPLIRLFSKIFDPFGPFHTL